MRTRGQVCRGLGLTPCAAGCVRADAQERSVLSRIEVVDFLPVGLQFETLRALSVWLVSSHTFSKTCSLGRVKDNVVVGVLDRGANGIAVVPARRHASTPARPSRRGANQFSYVSVKSPTSRRNSLLFSPRRSYLFACLCARCLAVWADSLPGDIHPIPVCLKAMPRVSSSRVRTRHAWPIVNSFLPSPLSQQREHLLGSTPSCTLRGSSRLSVTWSSPTPPSSPLASY